MKVLIIGSGAREHALAWKFGKSRRICGLYIAPGNAGTAELGENIDSIDPYNSAEVIQVCREKEIDLVFIGPEVPLSMGLADDLKQEGISVIGAHQEAAKLESSKTFSKRFMNKHKIPTAQAKEFNDLKKVKHYIEKSSSRLVIKKNGLAAGKGVFESDDKEKLIQFASEVIEGDSLLIEEFLTGYEISIFALTDGKSYRLLPPAADFKKAKNKDEGLNTGGMGAICPVPTVSQELLDRVEKEVIAPTFKGIEADGLQFCGILYFGLMITEKGPKLLEYNIRFGDPEAQVVIPLIDSDFGNLSEAMVNQKLDEFPLNISDKSALGVVVASEGYPGVYKKGNPVGPIPMFPEKDVLVFHASTKLTEENKVVTGGGRCFTVVGMGDNILNANVKSYEAVPKVQFPGCWYRTDIGKKFFID